MAEHSPLRFAYADPPYIGQARKHYSHDPRCAEVDHAELIQSLERDYDGWALSCSSPSLRELLPLCPEGIRVCAWVKPFCAFKANVTLAYAWEPVIAKPLRARPRSEPTVRDWVAANITLQRGLTGAKPDEFCDWLFEAMGLRPEDEFHDMFSGTGAVTEAWSGWCCRRRMIGDAERVPVLEGQLGLGL